MYKVYPGPRSIIMLNNILIQFTASEVLLKAYIVKGVLLRFLLLYSPNFNLIKESFRDLKVYIRRFYRAYRYRFNNN